MTYPRLSDEQILAIINDAQAHMLAEAAKPQPQHPGHVGREMGLNCFQCGESIKPGTGEVCADCLAENG